MVLPDASGDVLSEMDVDAFRRLFPLRFFETHLVKSTRPDGRSLAEARETSSALGAVASADGSALVKIGSTRMLAAIKMEVMTPSKESPDEGCIAIDFHMPPICSPTVRPGRPAEAAPVVSKQLSDTISRTYIVWMLMVLFLMLLCCQQLLPFLTIPVVSMNDDGKVVVLSGDHGGKEPVNKGKRKLTLSSIPFSLTCLLHKNYILADPTAEEESVMETLVTVVLDSSGQLVSLYKPGGPVLAYTSAIQDCVALTRQRARELQTILDEVTSGMEVD
ncbi:exosome complex component RRP43 isoform X2 [Prunus dulcis]|uniref:exosome complex component RRP43 isoform X2 n=1 Tax=Prunus dulcis TaxID=3755 RepID=UPI001482F4D8|nr:exosome complex component RRP43 isoform X2 [Prunus dulcis]